jgi:hypothetical protein
MTRRPRLFAVGFAWLISVLPTFVAAQSIAQAEPEEAAVVQVMGVETLADYATVGRLLAGTEGVRRIDVTEANGLTVTFRVLVRGGGAALYRALDSSAQLARASGADTGQLVYEYRR